MGALNLPLFAHNYREQLTTTPLHSTGVIPVKRCDESPRNKSSRDEPAAHQAKTRTGHIEELRYQITVHQDLRVPKVYGIVTGTVPRMAV